MGLKKGKKGLKCSGLLFICIPLLKIRNTDFVCESVTLFSSRSYMLTKRLRAPAQQQIPEGFSEALI